MCFLWKSSVNLLIVAAQSVNPHPHQMEEFTYNKERKTCCKSEGVYSRKDCENDAETAVLYGVSDAVCV